MSGSGTWIDWQYLFDSAKLLAKCRWVNMNSPYEQEILRIEYPWIVIINVCLFVDTPCNTHIHMLTTWSSAPGNIW